MKWTAYLFAAQPAFDEAGFNAWAARLGLHFPEAYVELLRNHQGMVPEAGLFRYNDSRRENMTVMGPLFHFALDNSEQESYRLGATPYKQLPAGIVPFSEDPGGFPIAFDFRKNERTPAIVLVDTEKPVIIRVAEDFESFINGLFADE